MVPCSYTQIVETGRQRRQAILAEAARERALLAAEPTTAPHDGRRAEAPGPHVRWRRLVGRGLLLGGLRAGRASG